MIQIWSARNPQGYEYRQYGNSDRTLLDFEGLALVTIMRRSTKSGRVARTEIPDVADSNRLLANDKTRPEEIPESSLANAWLFEPLKPSENEPSISDTAPETADLPPEVPTEDEFPF